MLPLELVGETVLVASIEMKMIGELHEIYGQPITGDDTDRGTAILESWAQRRGVKVEDLGKKGIKGAFTQKHTSRSSHK